MDAEAFGIDLGGTQCRVKGPGYKPRPFFISNLKTQRESARYYTVFHCV